MKENKNIYRIEGNKGKQNFRCIAKEIGRTCAKMIMVVFSEHGIMSGFFFLFIFKKKKKDK